MAELAQIDTVNSTGRVTADRDEQGSVPVQAMTANSLYLNERHHFHCRIDKLFIALFSVQWPVAVLLAFYLTPNTWAGSQSSTHLHVYVAIGLGALLTLFPAWLAWRRPGDVITRCVIAAAAMMFTAIFIHLSGGRDEGHFHFFTMMAFIALYFDWRVIVTAVVVGALDHILRTILFPMSIFGVLQSPWFQLLRHVGWVVFEGGVLFCACLLIDSDWRRAASQLAVSLLREEENKKLLEENAQASIEMDKRQAEAADMAAEQRRVQKERLAAAEEAILLEQQAAETQRQQVHSLLQNVNQAVAGNLGTSIDIKGEDSLARSGRGLNDCWAH